MEQRARGSSSPKPFRTSISWPHFGHFDAAMSARVPHASHRTERIEPPWMRVRSAAPSLLLELRGSDSNYLDTLKGTSVETS